jgi:hypothetical protein
MTTINQHAGDLQEKIDRVEPGSGMDPALAAALREATADEQQQGASTPEVLAQQQFVAQGKAANVEGWKVAVLQVVPMLEAVVPEFKTRVTVDQWGMFGEALGETADFYGLGIGDVFNHPLAKLAITSFPILIAAVQIKNERIAADKQQRLPTPAASTAPIPPTQTPGTVTSDHPAVTVRVMDETQAPS